MINARSKTLDLEYQKLRDAWWQLWKRPLLKEDAGRLLNKKYWPDDMKVPEVMIRFLTKATKEAYDYDQWCIQNKPNYERVVLPGTFIFVGLFQGSRWLWERTWTSLKSAAELYGYKQSPAVMPKKLKDELRKVLL